MIDSKNIKTLTEAIEKLESASSSGAADLKQNLEKDYHDIRKTIDELRPYLSEMKSKMETQIDKTKSSVETTLKENPWAAIAFAGLVGLAVGAYLSKARKDDLK